jgi:RES domain-containing protein
MKIRAWRVVKKKHADEAFSGQGALKFGGRWNSIGTRLVYTSESLALAAIEILAGGISTGLLGSFAKIPVDFDGSLVEALPVSRIPKDWSGYPPGLKTQIIGDAWVRESKSVLLKVPSVVIREEFNYLINPAHPNFKKLAIGKSEDFSFDKRLIGPR